MNPFDRMDEIANRAVDRINATPFIMVPTLIIEGARKNPNARPTTAAAAIAAGKDLTDIQIVGEGIFEYASIEAGLQLGVRKSYRESNDLRALQVAREPVVSIDRRKWLPLPSQYPDQGWIIWFPQKLSTPTFEVTSVQPDGHGRIVLKLVERGTQPKPGEMPELLP